MNPNGFLIVIVQCFVICLYCLSNIQLEYVCVSQLPFLYYSPMPVVLFCLAAAVALLATLAE